MIVFLIVLFVFFIAAVVLSQRTNSARRENYISNYYFHKGIANKLIRKYPRLTSEEVDLVLQALRDYFKIVEKEKRNNSSKTVSY